MLRHKNSRRVILAGGVSAIALCAMPAMAQDTEVSDVIVTGQRAALQSAQTIKQNAEQIVDSITAVDIGALPDRSVTEAIQRIPGVTIGRTADGRDADRLSVEGSGVQIRGISWVRGELNGRDTFSARNGRVLYFEDVPPELMAGVDVYKNPSADIIEGGVGGTVNLRTRKPFDSSGQTIAYSADMSYGDRAKEWTPSFSGLYSNRWQTSMGEFGLLLNLSNSQLDTKQDTIGVDPFYARTDLVPGQTRYVPGGYGYRTLDWERERTGGAVALQWRPNDAWEATFQYLRSDATMAATEYSVGFNPGSGNGPASGTSFTYDADGYFTAGTLAQSPGGTTLGSATFDTRFSERQSSTSDYSFKLAWSPNDKWYITWDSQYVDAKTDGVDFTAFVSTSDAAPATLTLNGEGTPNIVVNNPASFFDDPANYYLNAAMDHHDDNDADQWAHRLDAAYTFDDGGWLQSFRFGVRVTDRESTTRETTYRWNSVVPSWSGDVAGQPAGTRPTLNNIPELQGYYALYPFDGFFRGDVNLPATFILPTKSLVDDYDSGGDIIAGIATKYAGGGWSKFDGDYSALTGGGGQGGTNNQTEKTTAAYGLLRFAGEAAGYELDGNVGVRVVKTKAAGVGLQTFNVLNGASLPAQDAAFLNGATSVFEGGNEYTNVLPSLNLRMKLSPQLQWRFAAGKAIVRPDFSQMQPVFAINATGGFLTGGTCSDSIPGGSSANCVFRYTASAGNPNLEPIRSTQFDTALEWYFAPTGSVTFTAFYKDISDFITNGVNPVEFTNNGVTRTVQVTQAYNVGNGIIKGFEFGYQQYYDFLPGALSGLGLQANFTYVESQGARNAAVNPYDSTAVNNILIPGNMPLEGLSKTSYNLALLYDKGPISARLAYNWRERYLLTTTAANINLPAYNDDYGQTDGSIMYTLSPKLKVGIQAANLFNAQTRILVGYPGTTRPLSYKNWVESDRRYSIVLRGTF
jgi:TonB-dependent receptor